MKVFDFVFLHRNVFERNYIIQKIRFIDMLFVFVQIDKKIVFLKSIQYLFDIFNIINRIFEINQNIVKIYNDVYIELLRERFIDINLK